ncbi:MAG: MerR family transcriptional regulator [Christensenellaceae bacterium]|nr:MerR family transcriptional regulator [Christensenellaceae bacterium]
MDYTVKALADLAGLSERSLRYYDQIGLLRPAGRGENGYRFYGPAEIERLRQILFYRELGVELGEIRSILDDPGFDAEKALERHLLALRQRRGRLEGLILAVKKAINEKKGGETMSDQEKFEAFKQNLIARNERDYGREVRKRYGARAAEEANAKLAGMSQEEWMRAEKLESDYKSALKEALLLGDPGCAAAQRACALHAKWLQCFYQGYSREYHLGLARLYAEDPRFRANYDEIAPGCAAFFCEAIEFFLKKQG